MVSGRRFVCERNPMTDLTPGFTEAVEMTMAIEDKAHGGTAPYSSEVDR